ncbi:MAG: hypothetical protein CBC35_11760 [Planctomycetes bacterium TMED75]|nr:acyl carrier protein [Planctomycetaceae bacterium]OUU90406.1 MAG: hypothetical protein CBC35_11760 [Planctomycetes bacterium TMED75]
MALSRTEVESRVASVLEEALGVDADEITPEATLINDLGAESIDFLDISFQLEKAFEDECSPETPFKIEQGELFPENVLNDPELVEDGRLTDNGMALLKEKMPHVDFSDFESDRSVGKIPELFTVKTLVDFCERKLALCAA